MAQLSENAVWLQEQALGLMEQQGSISSARLARDMRQSPPQDRARVQVQGQAQVQAHGQDQAQAQAQVQPFSGITESEQINAARRAIFSGRVSEASLDRYLAGVSECSEVSYLHGLRALVERDEDGVPQAAIEFLVDAVALDPGNVAYRNVIGALQSELGQTVDKIARQRNEAQGRAQRYQDLEQSYRDKL